MDAQNAFPWKTLSEHLKTEKVDDAKTLVSAFTNIMKKTSSHLEVSKEPVSIDFAHYFFAMKICSILNFHSQSKS